MLEISNIEKDINKIAEILVYSKQLTYDSYFMFDTKTNTKHIIISRDNFLKRIQKSFWILAIIELAKLFGDNLENDNFSIILLIKKLKRERLNSEYSNLITSEELKEIDSELKASNIKVLIIKLKELRNEHFAHTDKSPKNNIYDIKFYFSDCVSLIEKAEKIMNLLSTKILSKPIIFPNYKGEEMDSFFDKHIEFIELAGLYNLKKK